MRGAFERPRRRWTKSEDERLRRATSSAAPGAAPDWAAAARAVESRSAEDCEQRWHRVLRSGLVKGAFTEAEDEVLLQCMQSGPKPSWLDVSKRIAGRTGKQCRERWTNHVDPNLNKGGWTADEDSILASAHERWGNAWTRIAMLLPGRAENTIKNRWYRRNNAVDFGKRSRLPPPLAKRRPRAFDEGVAGHLNAFDAAAAAAPQPPPQLAPYLPPQPPRALLAHMACDPLFYEPVFAAPPPRFAGPYAQPGPTAGVPLVVAASRPPPMHQMQPPTLPPPPMPRQALALRPAAPPSLRAFSPYDRGPYDEPYFAPRYLAPPMHHVVDFKRRPPYFASPGFGMGFGAGYFAAHAPHRLHT